MKPVAWRWTNQFGKEVITSNRELAALMEAKDGLHVEPLFLGNDPLWQGAKVSIDMDTHFDGNGLRVFGRVVDWQPEDFTTSGEGIGLRLLCEYEGDNFGMLTQADLDRMSIDEIADAVEKQP